MELFGGTGTRGARRGGVSGVGERVPAARRVLAVPAASSHSHASIWTGRQCACIQADSQTGRHSDRLTAGDQEATWGSSQRTWSRA